MEELCQKCNGSCEVEEAVCGYCFAQQSHASCDDTWFVTVPCDVCCKEFIKSECPKFIPNRTDFSKM